MRLTTAEVVQHPHVCPIHINYSIFYTSAVTFSSNLGKGDCRSIKYNLSYVWDTRAVCIEAEYVVFLSLKQF